MIARLAESQIKAALKQFPVVGILGPRQVGKTTLALAITDHGRPRLSYLDLELQSDLAKLSDAELYLAGTEGRLVIFDEVQRMPGLFRTLRGIVDDRRRRGMRAEQFLALGSASVELLKQSSESLAGRIAYVELTPFLVEEVDRKPADREKLWLRGGFPDSFLARDDDASFRWREAFIRTCLERDIPALGPLVPAETLRRFWTMLAHEQGSTLNAARLAAGLGLSGQTVGRYLDLMVDLLLVRRLQPWAANVGKRLVRSPKVYVRDSGIVHTLLGLRDLDALLGHPVAGGSWEGFVIENLVAAAPAGAQAWFYRTAAGAEIDLVLEIPPGRQRWAIEIKRSSAPVVSKGFHLASADIDATRRLVVHPGTEDYPMGAEIQAMSLAGALAALRGIGPARV